MEGRHQSDRPAFLKMQRTNRENDERTARVEPCKGVNWMGSTVG
jgi:hypothetical protein